MTARLFSRTGETRGKDVEIDGEAVIGRDPGNTLVIDRPLMSSRHARVYFDAEEGRYVLEDLGSLNGTEIDGDRVSGRERLGHLHVITFAGTYDFFFFDPERARRRHPHPPARPEPAATPPPAASADDSQEVTAVEREPVALPGFLARRADSLGDSEPTVDPEITSIEREPVMLPGFLARRADRVRGKQEPDETPPDAPDEPAPVDGTVLEKLPVTLPDALSRRAEQASGAVRAPDAGNHETVDLTEIEDLISAEDEPVPRRRIEYQLVVTESGGRVRRFTLGKGVNLVGRGRGSAVVLDYPDLSRRHAIVTLAGNELRVRDLGSRNRTFLQDEPLDPQVDVELRPGDRLRFGSVEARLVKVGDGDGDTAGETAGDATPGSEGDAE